MKIAGSCAVAVLAAVSLASYASAARADEDALVVPPGAVIAGETIGEWTGDWWQAAIEAIDFPFPTGGRQPGPLGDVGGPVFFAVASPGPGSTTYTYDVPRGKYVLLPLYTYAWTVQSSADPCSDYQCARELSDRFVRATTALSVTFDSEPVRRLFTHFESTPDFFYANVPLNGWFAGGDPAFAGNWFGYTSGYWLMLKPLSAGRHVISVTVKAPYSSVCLDGTSSCDIPYPGPVSQAKTRLILNVACDERDRFDDDRCREK